MSSAAVRGGTPSGTSRGRLLHPLELPLDGEQHVLFRWKVMEEGSPRNARLFGDHVDGRALISLFQEKPVPDSHDPIIELVALSLSQASGLAAFLRTVDSLAVIPETPLASPSGIREDNGPSCASWEALRLREPPSVVPPPSGLKPRIDYEADGVERVGDAVQPCGHFRTDRYALPAIVTDRPARRPERAPPDRSRRSWDRIRTEYSVPWCARTP